MILVNVGEYTINVENVLAFHVEDDDTLVIFGLSSGKSSGDTYTIRLQGEASKRMQAWLKKNSEGINEESPGFAISASRR